MGKLESAALSGGPFLEAAASGTWFGSESNLYRALPTCRIANHSFFAAIWLCLSASGCTDQAGVPPEVFAAPPSAPVTMAGDALRTGWYPHQALLDPANISDGSFGTIFDSAVDGAVYVQPLVSNGVLLVATETNWLYGMDPLSGDILWSRNVGDAWNPSVIGCQDLAPAIGVTGTPVIDPNSGTAYLFSATADGDGSGAAVWLAHGVDIYTGDERPGFPVKVEGTATNEPGQVFDPTMEMQRPGLLLMDGVVYAGFAGHCDITPFTGWIAGVTTDGRLATLWTTESGSSRYNGGGIWQSGGGLVSDRPGQILFATGNDGNSAPVPTLGTSPPGALGESVVRLSVQPDGSLLATDFFQPEESAALNEWDLDLGSGAPVALPGSPFGTPEHPNLMVQIGKSGVGYLLDREHLGGFAQASDGADDVIQRFGPDGQVWSKPSVWPGDGGYLYVPAGASCPPPAGAGCLEVYSFQVDSSGQPSLSLAATSVDVFGFGSGSGVITSEGTRSGSAALWIIWSPDSSGVDSQLRAYDAVPVGGMLNLLFEASIGQGSKFATPGVGNGEIYVGTRDGHVLGFGMLSTPELADVRSKGSIGE